jgi:hypothetical protein
MNSALAGLDHYFAAQYDFAIQVWTRVLFLDRSHARALRGHQRTPALAGARSGTAAGRLRRCSAATWKRGLVQAAIDGGARDKRWPCSIG